MKFTKHAYAKVWQNRPIADREDTTITLSDYEYANELNSIPVALLYLLEYHTVVNSMDESDILEHCLTTESQLAHKHQSNRADILRTLKLKTKTQPTFDLAEANQ